MMKSYPIIAEFKSDRIDRFLLLRLLDVVFSGLRSLLRLWSASQVRTHDTSKCRQRLASLIRKERVVGMAATIVCASAVYICQWWE